MDTCTSSEVFTLTTSCSSHTPLAKDEGASVREIINALWNLLRNQIAQRLSLIHI